MKKDEINAVGLWVLRLALVGGAIYCGITGKNDIASTCAVIAVITFIL